MSKKEFDLIVMDLDGTLLRGDYTISSRTMKCLEKCSEKGHKIMFCTGRRWKKVTPILKDIAFPVYCALNNGVVLRKSNSMELIFKKFLPYKFYKELVIEFREMNLIPIVHIFDDKVDFIFDDFQGKENAYLDNYIEKNKGKYQKVGDLLDHEDENIIQFCIMDHIGALEPAEKKIKKIYGNSLNIHVVRNVQYLGCALEVLSRDASKYSAAKYVMDLHGIEYEKMIAFGDDINDLELLKKAGFSVAMGNALDEVKEMADMVTKSNNQDGVAIVLEKMLLDESL